MNKTQLRKGVGPIEKLLPPRGFYLLKEPDAIVCKGDVLSMGKGWQVASGAINLTVGYMADRSIGLSWVVARRGKTPKEKRVRKVILPKFSLGKAPAPPSPVCPALPRFVRLSLQDEIKPGDLVADGNIYAHGGYWERAHAFAGKSCLELSCNGRTVWACRCVQVGGAA